MTVSDDDMTMAFNLMKQERYEEALKFCNRLVAANPTHPTAYSLRGLVWARRGNYDEACRDRDMNVALTPAHAMPLTLYLRGRMHKDFQAYHKAIDDFTAAMEGDDEHVAGISRMERADCHRLLGDFDRAEADCQAIPASFKYHGAYGASPGTRDLLLGDIREDRAKFAWLKTCGASAAVGPRRSGPLFGHVGVELDQPLPPERLVRNTAPGCASRPVRPLVASATLPAR